MTIHREPFPERPCPRCRRSPMGILLTEGGPPPTDPYVYWCRSCRARFTDLLFIDRDTGATLARIENVLLEEGVDADRLRRDGQLELPRHRISTIRG